jgi:uncharacterized membrane protein
LLDDANFELTTAQTAYESGEYSTAKETAKRAQEIAHDSEKPSPNLTIYLVASLGILSTVALLSLRKKPINNREIEEKPRIHLQKLFSHHPNLRQDEKEVIKFIASSLNGFLVSEIRKNFDIPKSSAWRMVRRLAGEKIIVTSSVGRETLIQIHPMYGFSMDQSVAPWFQKVPAGSYY